MNRVNQGWYRGVSEKKKKEKVCKKLVLVCLKKKNKDEYNYKK